MKNIFIVILLFTSHILFGQVNDLCANATSLPCGTSGLAGTTVGASNISDPASCASSYGVWYTFTGDGNSTTISATATGGWDHEMVIYSGSCGSLTNITCRDAGFTNGTETYTFTSTAAVTYYVYIGHYSTSSSTTGTFNITRTCAGGGGGPANDLCANATSLPCGTTNLAGTTVGTSNISDGTGCTIADYGVWYTFTGDGNSTTISATGSSYDIEMAIASGSCGSLTNITCQDGSGSTGTESHTFTTTLGVTYYVYIAHYSSSSTTTGTFTISRSCASAPSNDLCANATALPCGTTNLAGTTVATSNTAHGTGCTIANYGVWYTFTGDGNSTTISATGSSYDIEMAIASGSCGSLSNITCQDGSGSTGTESYTFTTTLGVNYYVYIAHYSSSSTTTGTFTISRSCSSPPSNDLCANATSLPCGTTNLAGSTTATSNTTHGTGCSMANYGVWYTFTGDGQQTTISATGSSFDIEMAIASGSCGSLSNITCEDGAGSTGTETYTFVATLGVTYYVYIAYYSAGSTTTGNFTISRSCTAAPTPPVNDECSSPTVVAVNNDQTCTLTTPGTIELATASADGNTCFGTDDDDVWFSFVASATTHYVELLNVAGSTTDLYHVLYSGACGTLTQMYCSDANSSTASGLTVGNTYFIRVYTWTSTSGQNTTFDVCVNSDPPPITACSGNFYDTGGSGGNYSNNETYYQTYCSSVPGQCLVMTFSSFSTEACCDDLTIYNGPDLSSPIIGTYAGSSLPNGGTITASSGCLTILWDSDGSAVSSGWAATISCGACPAPTCSDGIQNGTETGIDCGGSCSACPAINACGNLNNNDFCSDPAVLTQGGSSWSSSTTNVYSADDPGTSFCGSIENNSWYVFTAVSTTETFNFTSITNCTWNDGIQAEVFDVTTDGNGCCTSLSSVSNCWNPWNTSPGTVTASGLTIGNDYYLMVDGWGGDNCDFTVSGWSATGILPVKLLNFDAYKYRNGHKLIWTTQTEINNDYFIVQKSSNGKDFLDLGIVDGNGTSNNAHSYEFVDNSSSPKIIYYRLKQIDFDGKYEYSEIIVLKSKDDIDVSIYPNPTSNNLFFDISDSNDETYSIIYSNVLGSITEEKIQINKGTNTYQVQEFSKLESGIYFVQIINEAGEMIKAQKIIKQ